MKGIEIVSSGKDKSDSLTGKSVIDSTISQFDSHMNKILGINNENYIDTLLSKTNCQPQITYLMVSQVTYCILGISIKIYCFVISFTLSQIIFNIKS